MAKSKWSSILKMAQRQFMIFLCSNVINIKLLNPKQMFIFELDENKKQSAFSYSPYLWKDMMTNAVC